MDCDVVLWDDLAGADPIDLWMAEFYASVGTCLKDSLQNANDQIDPAVVHLLEPALHQTLESYYIKVFSCYDIREKIRAKFETINLLLKPTTPVTAFDAGLHSPPGYGDNISSWMSYTCPFNLKGQPAASVPAGFIRCRNANRFADGGQDELRNRYLSGSSCFPACPPVGTRQASPF